MPGSPLALSKGRDDYSPFLKKCPLAVHLGRRSDRWPPLNTSRTRARHPTKNDNGGASVPGEKYDGCELAPLKIQPTGPASNLLFPPASACSRSGTRFYNFLTTP